LADAQVEKKEWRSVNKLWWRETNTIGTFNFLQIIRKRKEKQFDRLWLRITHL
jgi:hypothetical protein